jgi:hypothetical protein
MNDDNACCISELSLSDSVDGLERVFWADDYGRAVSSKDKFF